MLTIDFTIVDKKAILRNFKDSMVEKYGKTAEGVINAKVYQLLKSNTLGTKELKTAENEINQMLNSGTFNSTKSIGKSNDKFQNKIQKTIKNTGKEIMKTKPFNSTFNNEDSKLPKMGSEAKVNKTFYQMFTKYGIISLISNIDKKSLKVIMFTFYSNFLILGKYYLQKSKTLRLKI